MRPRGTTPTPPHPTPPPHTLGREPGGGRNPELKRSPRRGSAYSACPTQGTVRPSPRTTVPSHPCFSSMGTRPGNAAQHYCAKLGDPEPPDPGSNFHINGGGEHRSKPWKRLRVRAVKYGNPLHYTVTLYRCSKPLLLLSAPLLDTPSPYSNTVTAYRYSIPLLYSGTIYRYSIPLLYPGTLQVLDTGTQYWYSIPLLYTFIVCHLPLLYTVTLYQMTELECILIGSWTMRSRGSGGNSSLVHGTSPVSALACLLQEEGGT